MQLQDVLNQLRYAANMLKKESSPTPLHFFVTGAAVCASLFVSELCEGDEEQKTWALKEIDKFQEEY